MGVYDITKVAKITGINQQQKNKNRYNIFLDDKFSFGIDENTLVQLGLRVGQEVDENKIEEYLKKADEGKLFDQVLRFLAVRPRSEKEVKDYLQRKINLSKPSRFKGLKARKEISTTENQEEFFAESTESLFVRLRQLNYLNDLEFAKWWIEQRTQGSKPRGERVIKLELRQKGVDGRVVDEALEEFSVSKRAEGWDIGKDIEKLALKKMTQFAKYPKREGEYRLVKYLLGRGFNYPDVKSVVDSLSAKV